VNGPISHTPLAWAPASHSAHKIRDGVLAQPDRHADAGPGARWKPLAAVIAISVAVLVLAGTALTSWALGAATAFLSPGRGSAPQWETRLGPATWSGPVGLYPGASNDAEYIPVSVTNTAGTGQRLTSITASIAKAPNGDAETADGADIPGCQASWFNISTPARGRVLPARIEPHHSYTGRIVLTMQDSGTNQDACRGTYPAITLSAR
jgi:hypothetical protein